jgi:hypothetical protein
MKEVLVKISITDGEQTVSNEFYVEADNFDEAVEKVENDLDVSLR